MPAKTLFVRRALVHPHRLQLVAPGIRNRSFAAVGQHDRRAVGGVEREQLEARRDLGRLGEQARNVLGGYLLHIGDVALFTNATLQASQ